MTTLTLPQRVAAKMITGLTRVTTGYAPAGLSEEWIGTMGVVGFFRFSMQATKIVGQMTKRFGEVDAQFLAGLSAAWNGCGFCGYGHIITASLLYFQERAKVHPLHPEAIEHMMDLDDQRSIAYLESVLDTDDTQDLRRLARLMFDLKMGHAEPSSAEDELVMAAVWLWTWTVECTITLGLTIRPEHAQPYGHPIGKNAPLRDMYERALADTIERRAS